MSYSLSQSRNNSFPLRDYGWSSDSDVNEEKERLSLKQCVFLNILWFFTQLMLFGSVLLFFYWVFKFDIGLDWQGDRRKMLNMHSILMLCGSTFLNGQAMLIYKMFTYEAKITKKTKHTILLMCSLTSITFGIIIGIQAQHMPHKGSVGVHFYSIHSWLGLVTVALFSFQLLIGLISFWALLFCKKGTTDYRTRVLPSHQTMGLIILSLSLATCLTGLSQTSRARLSGPTTEQANKPDYKQQSFLPNPFLNPGVVINMVGVCLIGVGISIPLIVRNIVNK